MAETPKKLSSPSCPHKAKPSLTLLFYTNATLLCSLPHLFPPPPSPSCLKNQWRGCERLCYRVATMDSSSLGVPGASSGACNDSLHGLKFGKKIYFENRSSGGSSSKSSSSPPPISPPEKEAPPPPGKKGKGGGQQQPPRCQVEGCMVDLTGAKAYYCRHKVCGIHSKTPKVIVGGLEQRFCQQCSS